jgi:hypothetical protein
LLSWPRIETAAEADEKLDAVAQLFADQLTAND